jgi:hypothetical protein
MWPPDTRWDWQLKVNADQREFNKQTSECIRNLTETISVLRAEIDDLESRMPFDALTFLQNRVKS